MCGQASNKDTRNLYGGKKKKGGGGEHEVAGTWFPTQIREDRGTLTGTPIDPARLGRDALLCTH